MSNATTSPGTRKVTIGALSGAAVTVIVGLLKANTSFQIPDDVAVALGTVVTTFLFYFTPESYTTKA